MADTANLAAADAHAASLLQRGLHLPTGEGRAAATERGEPLSHRSAQLGRVPMTPILQRSLSPQVDGAQQTVRGRAACVDTCSGCGLVPRAAVDHASNHLSLGDPPFLTLHR